ncbi:MAG TPA: AbrB family transcriptional regulator [Devosia sp.]|nr:AbrB family transcriptional regulator [Devosia sp.]
MSEPKLSRWSATLRTGLTVLISAAGGFAADLLHLPASWLMGGALAVAISALSGVRVMMPVWLRDLCFILTGMAMGVAVARDSLMLIVQWPVTLAALLLELIVIVATTGYMLRKLFRIDRGTAYMSSFPGHLGFVMGFAAAGVGDPRQITIIQVIRILMLTICVPIGSIFLPIQHFTVAAPAAPMPIQSLLAVGAIAAVAGLAFSWLRVPAGFVLGAMAVSTTAKLSGFFDGALPAPLVIVTFVLVGALIGSRFRGITAREFQDAATGGLIATAMTVLIVTLFAYGASMLVDIPFGQIWLGLSPGALEGMGALGVALGYDTAFIAAHHVSRLLMLTVAIPVVVLLVRGRGPASPGP